MKSLEAFLIFINHLCSRVVIVQDRTKCSVQDYLYLYQHNFVHTKLKMV